MKIAVIGCPGSGKTSFAITLHKILKIPLYHLDQYYWQPNWQRPDPEEFEKIHNDLCDKDEWIIEGVASRYFDQRFQQADIIIFLDMPKYLCYYLNSPITRNRMLSNIAGVAITRLTLVKLNNSSFIFAPINEQRQIVSEIETRLSVCDQLEQTIEESLKKAEALRQSILKKAFNGELTRDWREKNPELISGENSAEKLLERIKAEKAHASRQTSLAADREKVQSKKMKKK